MASTTNTPAEPNASERLLDAAYELILEGGVRALRVQDVAARAGVSISLIYYHFGDRRGLINATFGRATKIGTSALVDEHLKAGASGLAAVSKAVLDELPFSPRIRDAGIVWNEILALAMFEQEVRQPLASAVTVWRKQLAHGIRAGQADGSIRPDVDPRTTAELLASLIDGLTNRYLAKVLSERDVRRVAKAALAQHLEPVESAR
jgi:AcrR family transcriptional regulator